MTSRHLLLLLAAPLAGGVAEARGEEPPFVDRTERALGGLTVSCGEVEKRWIPEVNGGGVGLADFDRDGVLDLIVVPGSTVAAWHQGTAGPAPVVRLGNGDGTFREGGEAWELPAAPGWGTGLAVGDLDQDGDEDLVITQLGAVRLFLNDGGEGLVEATSGSGLPVRGWHTSAVLLEANGDGFLDLFLVRYLEFDPSVIPAKGEGPAEWKGHVVLAGPEGLPAQSDLLLLGKGDGTFEPAPLGEESRPAYGLGAVVLDVDGDGRDDVFVSNDSQPNHLWRQVEVGRFEEQAFALGVGYGANGREQAGMGIACEDLDGSGRPSLLVTNFSGESNALYRPASRASRYRERASRAGVAGASVPRLGWGTAFLDVELDGDLDAFVLNGHVYPEADRPGTDTAYAQPDELYRWGGARFDVEPLSANAPLVSRAGVAGDLDGDGDEDLIVLPVEGRVRVFENVSEAQGAWLGLRLIGPSGAPALGARVRLRSGDAEHPFLATRRVTTAGGYQAARPAELRLGIPRDRVADPELLIEWPSGQRTVHRIEGLDRIVTIEEPGR